MELKGFRGILRDALKDRGASPQKMSEETGIAPIYIRAFLDGDFEKLPALPYVRGYVERISQYLDIEFDDFWGQYKKEAEIKKSGEEDRLPINRFALQPASKKSVLLIAVVLIFLALIVPQISSFFGSPTLEVTNPDRNDLIVDQPNFILKGFVKRAQDKVLINDEEIVVFPDGMFEKEVVLSEKINLFRFKAKRFLGKEAVIERTIIYESGQSVPEENEATTTD